MSYYGGPGTAHKYIATDQPLYGLGGLGYMATGEGNGVSAYELRGLGSEPAPAATTSGPYPVSLKAPPGWTMPANVQSLWYTADGQPRAEAQSFLYKMTGRMVDANGAFFQGIICDNIQGSAAPGQSMEAQAAMKLWQQQGYFVVASLKVGICGTSKGAWGPATWVVYRVAPDKIGSLVGSTDAYVWGMPFNEPFSADVWAKYASFLAKGGGDSKTSSAPPGLSTAGAGGGVGGWLVIGALLVGAWWVNKGGSYTANGDDCDDDEVC